MEWGIRAAVGGGSPFFPVPSVVQLLASHGSLLLLDAAATTVHTGLLRRGEAAVWERSEREAGWALFAGAEACLRRAGLGLPEVGALVFCAGPGSMLGARTAAMAIRAWQVATPRPAYHYLSLVLLARGLGRDGQGPCAVLADARRQTWHVVRVAADGRRGELHRVGAAELAAGGEPLVQPAGFRAWAAAPRPAREVVYDPPELFARLAEEDLLAATERPDGFQHEAPVYQRWTAQVHRAAPAVAP